MSSSPETALRELLSASDIACPRCGYNLRGCRGDACPECGLALRVSVFEPPPPATKVYLSAQAGATVAVLMSSAHVALHTVRDVQHRDWRAVAIALGAWLLGVLTAGTWVVFHDRILRWPRHLQARAATAVWTVAALVILTELAA